MAGVEIRMSYNDTGEIIKFLPYVFSEKKVCR